MEGGVCGLWGRGWHICPQTSTRGLLLCGQLTVILSQMGTVSPPAAETGSPGVMACLGQLRAGSRQVWLKEGSRVESVCGAVPTGLDGGYLALVPAVQSSPWPGMDMSLVPAAVGSSAAWHIAFLSIFLFGPFQDFGQLTRLFFLLMEAGLSTWSCPVPCLEAGLTPWLGPLL